MGREFVLPAHRGGVAMDLQTFLSDFMNRDDIHLLTRDAGELFGCPVMLVDMAFHAVSWYRPADFIDAPFQASIDQGSLSYETGSFLAGSDAQARYVTPADSLHRRRFSLLVTGGVPVGYLILVDVQNRLDEVDARVYTAVESTLAKQLMLETSRGSSVQSTEESVLQALIEGRFEDEAMFELQVANTGLRTLAPRRFALVNLELYKNTNWSENALRSTILDRFPQSRPLMHNGSVVFFLNSDPDMELFRAMAERFNLRVVISLPIGKLFRLPEVYEATRSLMAALLPRMPHPFAVTAEPYHGLMLLKALSARGDLVLPEVRALGERDRADDTLYCLTLYTYLACHHSLRETCERLFAHRNTILYRVRRMKEDFGLPLDDPRAHMALLLSAALMLMELGREDVFMP